MTDKIGKEGLDGMGAPDGETCLRLAYDALFHGDFESAADWFMRAIELEPDNASYYYKASITFARSGKSALAENCARRAAELDPEDPVYAMNLNAMEAKRLISEARRLLELPTPEPGEAREKLLQAEALDPLSADAKLLLGWASRALGDLRSAVDYAREALSLEPQYEEASRMLRAWRKELKRFVRTQLQPNHPNRNR